MNESKRQKKFARLLQKELGGILLRKAGVWYKNIMVSVTHVQVSPDLGLAKVYLSIWPEATKLETFHDLQDRKAELRNSLAAVIKNQIRKIPDLQLYLDDSAAQSQHIDNLLNNLK